MESQLQHYVPAFHLRQFAQVPQPVNGKVNTDRYAVGVSTIDNKGSAVHNPRANTTKVAAEYNIYDKYSSEDYDIEFLLSRIESSISTSMPRIIKSASTSSEVELNHKEHRRLGAYLASLVARQPSNLANGVSEDIISDISGIERVRLDIHLGEFLTALFDMKYNVLFEDARFIRSAQPMALPLDNPIVLEDRTVVVALSTYIAFTGTYRVVKNGLPTGVTIPVVGANDYFTTLRPLAYRKGVDNSYAYNTEFVYNIKNKLRG